MLIKSEISHLSCSLALCFLLSLIVLDSYKMNKEDELKLKQFNLQNQRLET